MVSALYSRASDPGSSRCRGHCVVFLGKTLYSHSASLQPGVWMGTGELLGNLTNCGGVTCDGLTSRLGKVEILPATSCYSNQDKLRQLWASLGSKASLVKSSQNFKKYDKIGMQRNNRTFQGLPELLYFSLFWLVAWATPSSLYQFENLKLAF